MRDDRAGLQGQPWVKMAHFIVLQFSRSDDILAVGKMLTVLLKHAKNPVRQHRVFLYHFGEAGLNLRLTAADASRPAICKGSRRLRLLRQICHTSVSKNPM